MSGQTKSRLWVAIIAGAAAALVAAFAMPASWIVVPTQTLAYGHDTQGEKPGYKEFYACPMFCTRMDKPGKCPVCGMELEKFVDTGASLPLDAKDRAAMNLITEPITARELAREIRTLGTFEVDETREKIVSAWVEGRIERLYADFTGMAVSEGDHLLDLYSPELYTAQKELLLARDAFAAKAQRGPEHDIAERMLTLAREKLRRLGLTAEQLMAVESAKEPSATLTITAPTGGIVMEKMARPGMYVEAGMPLYHVADLSRLWLVLNVHERDVPWVTLGQQVEVAVRGLPEEKFQGVVAFIEPMLHEMTRTARVRVEVPNIAGAIKPGMFGTALIFARLTKDGELAAPALAGDYACPMHPLQRASAPNKPCPVCGMEMRRLSAREGKAAGKVPAVPRAAVLSTGTRNVVYVEWWVKRDANGATQINSDGNAIKLATPEYQGFEVTLGPLAVEYHIEEGGRRHKLGEYYPVLSGLPTGVAVVANGQFLIDSQLELTGKPSLFRPEGGGASQMHKH